MSNSLSISSVINKNAIASDVPMLSALTIEVVDPATLDKVDTLRVVANTEDITLGGEVFSAMPYTLSLKQSDEQLPTVSLNIVDTTQTVQRFLQEYKGGNESNVTIHFFFAESTVIEKADVEYTFSVTSSSTSAQDYSVSWQLGAENPLTLPIPARMQMRERCQWEYKSQDCGYNGSLPTCDLSLSGENGCRAHNNVVRFGGLPGITVRNL